jgi:hypothetical protein
MKLSAPTDRPVRAEAPRLSAERLLRWVTAMTGVMDHDPAVSTLEDVMGTLNFSVTNERDQWDKLKRLILVERIQPPGSGTAAPRALAPAVRGSMRQIAMGSTPGTPLDVHAQGDPC